MEENKLITTENERFLGQNKQKAPHSVRNKKLKGGIAQRSANIFFYTMVALPLERQFPDSTISRAS